MKLIARGLVVAALATAAIAVPTSAFAASAPTTSPAAYSRVFQTTSGFTCDSGFACAKVPYSNGWYIFKFYNYGTYGLSNWFGEGIAFNSQTGAAAMRLYDGSGNQVECIPGGPPAHYDDSENWDPIWSIKLTSSPC
jgi:hypothetical protein